MDELDLQIEIARAAAAAKRKDKLRTTREVPQYARDVNRFVINQRQQQAAAMQEQSAARPLNSTDLALIAAMPMAAGTDLRTRAAIGQGLSLGIPDLAMSAIDTLSGYLTGEPATFGENLQQRQDEARVRKAYAPMASTAAELAAGGVVGGALGKAAQGALSAVAPSFSATPVGTALAQGAAGALEGGGYSAITGEGDPLTSAILGGGLGAITGMAFPLTGAAAADAAKRQAAERMFGPTLNSAIGREADRPLDIIDVLARRRELGPEATIADLDPLLGIMAEGAMNPRTAEAAAPLIAAAGSRTRPVADILIDDIDAAISPSYGKVARADDRAAIIQDAQQKYDTALTEMRNTGFSVDAADLRSTIESAFTRQGVTTSSFASARDRMLAELDGITGYKPPRYNKKGELIEQGNPGKPDLTVDEALALKKEFDIMVSQRDPAQSVPREVRAVVIDTKNALNDQLKSNSKFAESARIYADEFDIQNAEEFAKEVFRGNYSADDFSKMYARMSDLEKQAVARAARDEIQVKFFDKPGGAERFARRVGPTQDAAFTQKLDTIFGTKAVDKLYDAAMRARAFGGTSQIVDTAARKTVEDAAKGIGASRSIGNFADLFTILQQSAQGRATSGATAGALRRLFVEGKKASNTNVQNQMLDYLGQQGPQADAALMEIMSYLYGTAPARLSTGLGGAVGGAAATGYGAIQGPQ